MHVSALRRKLGDDPTNPRRIVTVRGVGFRLEPG
jgi:DNA-binding response OmpR family regulator